MSTPKLIAINIAILVVGLCTWLVLKNWSEWNIAYKFIIVMLLTIGVAYLVVTFILPTIGDSIAAFFYSAPEKAEPDAHTKAASKLAQGDYKGAIGAYRSLAREQPEDRFPIVEIAKIQREQLHDHDGAIATIQEALDTQTWAENDGAFLRFRLGEIYIEDKANEARYREILESIIAEYPETRHSANATHRLNELSRA